MEPKTNRGRIISGGGNRGWNLRNAMIIVANIPSDMTEYEFLLFFSNVEGISELRFIKNSDCRTAGTKTAIIQFESTALAVSSIDKINGHYVRGKILVVFSVKELRDYVRIPESTFLVASQESGFSNQMILNVFSPIAHINHYYTNTRNKSNPLTGVAVFKDSTEYTKAEAFINGWKQFEDGGIMAIKTPSLSDYYDSPVRKTKSMSPNRSRSSSSGETPLCSSEPEQDSSSESDSDSDSGSETKPRQKKGFSFDSPCFVPSKRLLEKSSKKESPAPETIIPTKEELLNDGDLLQCFDPYGLTYKSSCAYYDDEELNSFCDLSQSFSYAF